MAGMKRFDRKFGPGFVSALPTTPAVYLFRDEQGAVLYVGKAKNVRERLRSYRNASRRKVHRKMRAIVRDATTLEVRPQDSETDALAMENELIRKFEPPYNVVGKYAFLYPAVGLCRNQGQTLLCFTTDVGAWSAYSFSWFGVFPSRPRAKESFDALCALLALVGHREPVSALGSRPDVRGSRMVGFRQLPAMVSDGLTAFLGGRGDGLLRDLTLILLEKPRARREAQEVQARLRILQAFYAQDLAPLHRALKASGQVGTFVHQDGRDTLFIRHGAK